jgi:glycine/D-amino acid oxidase-like deaminating enzyme
MTHPAEAHDPWGIPPWKISFRPPTPAVPAAVDFAVVGAGFTGLAAAAWLRHLDPQKSVVVLEAHAIGAGASGRTGGMVLDKTAADDLPGLGDVLGGLTSIVHTLGISCDLTLPGAWEIARGRKGMDGEKLPPPRPDSPIEWNDSGALRVVDEVPGGSLDPGKMVSELARVAHEFGATIVENAAVKRVEWREQVHLHFAGGELRAKKVLFATNALSLELTALKGRTYPKLTLAVATAPLSDEKLKALGLSQGKPFYTVDLPYLWGRVRLDNSIVWGAGLVDPPASQNVEEISVQAGDAARMFAAFEKRVRNFHPATKDIEFTHRWGGPILFREDWTPIFSPHPASSNAIVLGAYAGHGVAQSVYFGAWAAEAMLGRRDLPAWGRVTSQ